MTTRSQTRTLKPKLPFTSYTNVPLSTNIPPIVLAALNNPIWKYAMQDKIDALKRNNTWTLIAPTQFMNVVGCKWVFPIKHNSDGSIQRFKACLVTQGFNQTPSIDYHETFNLVMKPPTIRLILTLATSYHWPVHQLNINNAFLNGHLQERVYMSQPPSFVDSAFPSHVCQLNKALYGLKQAPSAWFDRLRLILLEWGFKNSKADSS